MEALGLALGLALPALVIALVVSLLRTASAMLRRGPRDSVTLGAQRRTDGATAAVGLAVVAVVVLTSGPSSWGNPLTGAVSVLGVGALMALTATLVELTWPRPRGAVRRAAVRPRPEVNPALRRLRTAGAGALAALCALTAVLGATEGSDHGRRLPNLTAFRMVGDGLFPGWPYGLALLAALGVLMLVTTWGLRVVEARPALDDAHAGLDAFARLTSSARLLRIAACTTWLAVLGVAFVAGSSLHEYAQGLRLVGSPAAHHPPLDWRQDLAFGLFGLGVLAGVPAFSAAVARAGAVRPLAETRAAAAVSGRSAPATR